MNEIVVYQIVNKVNNKIYIGSSSRFSLRKAEHLRDLKGNRHHSRYLQRSWNKYGEENFSFEILEFLDDENNLVEREQFWIDAKNSSDSDFGYNMCPLAGRSTGYKHSAESKLKISESSKGRGYLLKGRVNTEDSKKKVSETLKRKYAEDSEFAQKQKQARQKQRGESNARAKLTETDVIEIKSLLDSGKFTQKEIANIFNITQKNVSQIKLGRLWSHVS